MNNNDIILQLYLINGIGAVSINKLIFKFGIENLAAIYNCKKADFIALGFSEKLAIKLLEGLSSFKDFEVEKKYIEKNGIKFFSILSEDYPELLKKIEFPPPILYLKGNFEIFKTEKIISFVGSRDSHGYGKFITESLVRDLVLENWTIVSGGACGADTFAHEAALRFFGKTAVVLGAGLLQLAPTENKALFEAILKNNGALVSIFSCNQKPMKNLFPVRNRVISGLSLGTVIVQATEKSGALITAAAALNQGRDVFAVPGLINDRLSFGVHNLIKAGSAKLVTLASDIIVEYPYLEKEIIKKRDVSLKDSLLNAVLKNKVAFETDFLSLFNMPITIDQLLTQTSMSLDALNEKLFQFSLEGLIEQDSVGFWRKV